jgi:predicted RNase H-like HicB family nuclease
MSHYVAIVEDAGPETAVGVWFPDLPGCFSAGDTLEEAIRNAGEALILYAEALERGGGTMRSARMLSELKEDPEFAADIRENMVALIPLGTLMTAAAE